MPKNREIGEPIAQQPKNWDAKENVKKAWEEGDLVGLIFAGIDSFMDMWRSNTPIQFQKFLNYTGDLFDKYILEVSQQEHLNFVGGKMLLQTGHSKAAGSTPIQLFADFYFQTPDKQWVVKKKHGQVDSSRFLDWDTDKQAVKLQKDGELELSIEPPVT